MTCLLKTGNRDPVSLMAINPKQDIIKNFALENYIREYLKKNPWAFEKIDDNEENLSDIKYSIKE